MKSYFACFILVWSFCSEVMAAFPPNCHALWVSQSISTADGRLKFYQKSIDTTSSLEEFAKLRYGKLGLEVLQKLRSISPSNAVLIGDPGVVLRIDEFTRFALLPENKQTYGWSLREKFKTHLGKQVVWRGMALTSAQAEQIINKGINARYLRPEEAVLVRHSKVNPYQHNIFSMIEERVLSSSGPLAPRLPRIDSLVSVTEDIETAKKVTKWFLEEEPTLNGYLFQLEVPRLDLIFAPNSDPKIESFVLLRIHPGEIQHVELIE